MRQMRELSIEEKQRVLEAPQGSLHRLARELGVNHHSLRARRSELKRRDTSLIQHSTTLTMKSMVCTAIDESSGAEYTCYVDTYQHEVWLTLVDKDEKVVSFTLRKED